jgi:hypothetical protein
MSGLRPTISQRRGLERQLRATHDAGLCRRTLATLEAADGRPVAGMARSLRTSRVTIYRRIECFDSPRDPACLVDSRGGNRPSVWTEDLQAALSTGLGRRPDHFGYRAAEWTAPCFGSTWPDVAEAPVGDPDPPAAARLGLCLEAAAVRPGPRPRAR